MRKHRQKEELPARCEWCSRGIPSVDGRCIFCKKRGVMDAQEHCPHYDYDPLRRVPCSQPVLPTVTEDDFKL